MIRFMIWMATSNKQSCLALRCRNDYTQYFFTNPMRQLLVGGQPMMPLHSSFKMPNSIANLGPFPRISISIDVLMI